MPKDTYGLIIEYRPSVSGVVANLDLGECLGGLGQSSQRGPGLVGGRGRSPPEAESFLPAQRYACVVRRDTASDTSDTSESNYILGRGSALPQTPPRLGPAELLN